MRTGEYLGKWLVEEREHQAGKFSHASQVEQLRSGQITSTTCFGGQAENYWGRLQNIRRSPEFNDPKLRPELLPLSAQYSAKVVSAITAIFTTLKTQNQNEYGGVPNMAARDIVMSTNPDSVKVGSRWLDTPDFYDTHTGMGVAWYAKRVADRGVPETNLGIAADLIRIRPIYLDAANVAIAQFQECLEETGRLPLGGTSSGNVTLWTPTT